MSTAHGAAASRSSARGWRSTRACARRFAGFEHHTSELDPVAGFQRRERVFGFRLRAQVNCSAGLVAKLEVTRKEIRVQVGEDDVTDLEIVRPGFLEILLHSRCGSTTAAVPVTLSPTRYDACARQLR